MDFGLFSHEELVYFICSRTRSPRLWDVKGGNSFNTFDVYFNSSNIYPVEYYLESVEEYSEGKINLSEPESGNGNVNTVYFVNQAMGDTRVTSKGYPCSLIKTTDVTWIESERNSNARISPSLLNPVDVNTTNV